MSVPAPLEWRWRIIVACTLIREAWRACLVPLRFLCYLPFRKRWRRSTAEAVAAASANPPTECDLSAAAWSALANKRIFLSAAEPSGDHHAAELARALLRQVPSLEVFGFGGPELSASGARVLINTTNRAAMGFSGVLKLLPAILREVGIFVRWIEQERPALVAFVDAPAYHLVLARLARKRGIPVFHYVCPQVWGWAPWRLARLRQCVDRFAAILPFEPPWFAQHGVSAFYVGHPRVEHWAHTPPVAAPAAHAKHRKIALLPGSRRSDLRSQMPSFLSVAKDLFRAHPDLQFEILQQHDRYRSIIEQAFAADAPELPYRFVVGDLRENLVDFTFALVKSGTGSFDVALAGLPAIVLYRLASRRERWLRHLLMISPAIAQANFFEPGLVPEFILSTPAELQRASAVALHWAGAGADDLRVHRQRLVDLRSRLDGDASRRAAAHILSMIKR